MIKSDPYFWNQVLFYLIQPSWIIPLVFCFYVTIKELKKDPDAKYILASFIIIGVLFVNDVLIERRLYDFMSLSNCGFVAVIFGTAIIMRNRFARLYSEVEIFRAKKSRRPAITDETRKKFAQAVAFIEENYMHDISRENFAESLEINHDYLGKLFIQYKGKKMSDYINELRIKKASELLLADDRNVTEIAFEVGFDSLSTFYRVFQKFMGEKPTDYRERNKKNDTDKQ
jgi:YesN/AraC family two-component response regulator